MTITDNRGKPKRVLRKPVLELIDITEELIAKIAISSYCQPRAEYCATHYKLPALDTRECSAHLTIHNTKKAGTLHVFLAGKVYGLTVQKGEMYGTGKKVLSQKIREYISDYQRIVDMVEEDVSLLSV